MTREELEKEAEEYFKSICGDYNEEYERTGKRHYWVGFDIKNAYIASAEPREKRIAELEKENARQKALLDAIDKAGEHVRQQITEAFRNKRPYWELEQENAKLKLKLKALDGQTPWKDIKDKSEVIGQLTNAKELLKQWLSLCGFKVEKLSKDTEQFIKETEK